MIRPPVGARFFYWLLEFGNDFAIEQVGSGR
jgi:hypothetical protein